MTRLYFDTETYSETPIKNGTFVYAADAEVMLAAYAIDDGEVKVRDLTAGDGVHDGDLGEALRDPSVEVVIQNSMFDRSVMQAALNVTIPIERVHDTMVCALAHGLPAGLEALGEVFRLPADAAKDKRGKQLIHLFCKPQADNRKIRRATRLTHPTEWQAFKDYAAMDIVAMREIRRLCPTWNYTGFERELWNLDQTINFRGFAVDMDLARAAVTAVDAAQIRLAQDAKDLTFGLVGSTTQRDEILSYVLNAYGVALPDMKMATVERHLDNEELPYELREILRVRLQATTTSTSKYEKLLEATNSDGRLRGTLQFCGASRTGRWAGRVFQPQNLKRSSISNKEVEFAIKVLKAGCADLFYD